MAEVTRLKTRKESDKEELISRLEEYLAHAKAGRLRGFLGIFQVGDGIERDWIIGGDIDARAWSYELGKFHSFFDEQVEEALERGDE